MTGNDTVVPASGSRPEIRLPHLGLFIDGRWCEPTDGGTLQIRNPATEATIVEAAAATAADVDKAVTAARHQVDDGEWSRLSGVDRGRLLLRLADAIERDSDYFAKLETLDIGQPAPGPAAAVDTLRYFAGWADKIDGRHVSLPNRDGRRFHSYTVREPVGVVAAITPWNSPTMITAWKLAPALAAGCSVVLKPPEDAPLSSLHFASLVQEVGFPAGSVNVIPGVGDDAGAALVRHPGVDKVSFTGSPEVGREIARAAAESFKRLTLELGGKAPQLIFADADFDQAIPAAARSFYAHGGQICAAGTRVLVAAQAADELVAGLVEQARSVRVGDPFEPTTNVGALINEPQLERVMGYIRSGADEGAELVTGGKRMDGPGYFVEPTVFKGSNDLTISQDEIFGPVATVMPFHDLDDALRLANATRYGLSANVWTRDLATAHLVARRIRAGAVQINTPPPNPPNARLPWGGMKSSGVGRELSFSGIEACTEEKAVVVCLD
jgi:betaine-aldehyde dehydrogenase